MAQFLKNIIEHKMCRDSLLFLDLVHHLIDF